jgi:23S rRNA (cytidine1920-2'-O)/16S rRNA (cytidine1409-2'-O)-methyltransferase
VARRRLDSELVRRGLVQSRTEAAHAVRSGLVTIGGRPAAKPSTLVDPAEAVDLAAPPRRYVSRGGEKLAAALDGFGIEPRGRDCLDVGASTGGFTDCLLQRGAARVIAVDVGYGQLAWTLREDPRVVVLERTNVRELHVSDIPFRPELLTVDVSFISLDAVVPALAALASPDARFVLLVKPQFEAARSEVGKGGVVRDPETWRRVLEETSATCRRASLVPQGAVVSPLVGPAGNAEFFLLATTGGDERRVDVDAAVAEAQALRSRP